MNLEHNIEAILLFKNEPVSFKELAKILDIDVPKIKSTVESLRNEYKERGMVIIEDDDAVSLGTHPDASKIIEKIQKEELSRDLGRAGLETLSIILYKGPVSRREIDYIRGVNSGFIVRNLLVRGLVERSESEAGERSFSYKPTLELLRYLGVTKREELPEFADAFSKIETFVKTEPDAHE
jgi:segregation and condensation protein B